MEVELLKLSKSSTSYVFATKYLLVLTITGDLH